MSKRTRKLTHCAICRKRLATVRDAIDGEPRICDHCRPDPQVVDDVSERDRIYFEEHPEATSRIRPAVKGELPPMIPPHDDAILVVEVIRLGPGARVRCPSWLVPSDALRPLHRRPQATHPSRSSPHAAPGDDAGSER